MEYAFDSNGELINVHVCIHDQIVETHKTLVAEPCFRAETAKYIAPQIELIPSSETVVVQE